MKQIEIYVDDNYFDLVPRPSKDQRKALKESMREDGQLEPIVCDSTGKIIDGYTRFEICQELSIEPKYVIRPFKDEQESKNYAITTNLKRRQLNDYQIYELFEKQIDMIRQENVTKRNQNIWKTRKGEQLPQTYQEKYGSATTQKASELTGLGRGTVEAIVYIKNHADEKMLEQVKEGTLGIHKANDILRRKTKVNNSKGITYRSKIGITYDIMRSIIESETESRISQIARKTNLSHYSALEFINLITKSGLVRQEIEKTTSKRYKNKNLVKFWKVTPRGLEFFNRCRELYTYLPEEFQNR